MKNNYDTIVIGAGPAGLAAGAKTAEKNLNPLILENSERIGGIPIQCTHPGFGLFYYDEELTGPEFSYRLIDKIHEFDVDYLTNAHVTEIEQVSDLTKIVKVITQDGIKEFSTSTIIYTTGARERHVYETGITGDRVSGVFTAGETQTLMDIYGVMPGKEIVIVGSGDVGLIMARRFALEGAEVKGVMEMLPYPGGLTRNVAQCLRDFEIPLYTQRAVKEIRGEDRVEEVITVEFDDDLQPIPESEEEIKCDTVVLSTGLIPYIKKLEEIGVVTDPATKGPVVNEFLETNVPGIFVAGNALTVNDYVDYVADQGELAGLGSFKFLDGGTLGIPTREWKRIRKGRNIRFVVPHYVSGTRDVTLYARAEEPEPQVKIVFDEIGIEIEKQSVTPGEMIKVEISEGDLTKAGDKITMAVKR